MKAKMLLPWGGVPPRGLLLIFHRPLACISKKNIIVFSSFSVSKWIWYVRVRILVSALIANVSTGLRLTLKLAFMTTKKNKRRVMRRRGNRAHPREELHSVTSRDLNLSPTIPNDPERPTSERPQDWSDEQLLEAVLEMIALERNRRPIAWRPRPGDV